MLKTQFLILFIGIPGSGKSTLAKKWQKGFPYHCDIFEADMYFEKDGQYNWDPKKLNEAHKWCFDQTENTLKNGGSVIVANTFLTPSSRKPYIELAKKYNTKLTVFPCIGEFKNIHGIPQEKVNEMKKKYVPYSKQDEF